MFSILRGCLAIFVALRDRLSWILGPLGMLQSRIWDWFLAGKWREFGLVFFIEVIPAIINLMLGF